LIKGPNPATEGKIIENREVNLMTGKINLLTMKKVIGLVLLLIVLVAVSGCTQQTKTVPATTVAPTEVTTTVETVVETTVEAPVATIVETPVVTTAEPTPEITVNSTAVPVTTGAALVSMTPSTKITTVHIVNGTFSPATLVVLPGTGITWVNDDLAVHSVKMIGEHAGKFNSGDIVKGASWSYSFGENEGTFQYADGYHLNVTGVIIVKKGDSLLGNVVSSTPYVTSNATW
jgi:plastocyanin